MPLHVEILYNEYNFVGAFATASLLAMLALVTLGLKALLESRHPELRAPQPGRPAARPATGGPVNAPPKPPRKYLLATWLSAGNLLIVLVALVLMALASSIAVGRFAERQGLARSELAVTSAREFLRRLGESTLSAARTLADRPTLARLLDDPSDPGLGSLPRQLLPRRPRHRLHHQRRPGGAGRVRRRSAIGPRLPPRAPNRASASCSRRRISSRRCSAPRSACPPIAGLEVVMLQELAGDVLREAARESGAALALRNIRAYQAPESDPLTPLHGAALTNGEHAAAHIRSLQSYAASAVIVNATGEPVALLDAQLPTAEFDRSAASYRNGVILISVAVAVLLGIVGILYGLWLSAPVTRLADMARRIGLGDFSPAVPAAMPRELDTLARAMDDMRHNLIGLTDTLRRQEGEARAVLANVVEGVFVTDAERRIVYANPQFSRTAPGGGQRPDRPLLRRRAVSPHGAGRSALRARLPDPGGAPHRARPGWPSSFPSAMARCDRRSSSARRRRKGARCSCCATRPTSRPRGVRATACSATFRTSFAPRSRHSWPPSRCCAAALRLCRPRSSATCSATSSAGCCA